MQAAGCHCESTISQSQPYIDHNRTNAYFASSPPTTPGLILQFPYFKRNDSSLLFMLFWLFGMAMTSYSYCLSVFMKKTQVGGAGAPFPAHASAGCSSAKSPLEAAKRLGLLCLPS